MKIGALIIAGGKSTRMGKDKASLSYENETFAVHLAKTLSDYEELLLSRADDTQEDFGLRTVYDIYPDCGPIGALHSALKYCKSEALLTVPCDTPEFSADFGKYLCSQLSDEYDAVVVTEENRKHPLCAVYRKKTATILEQHIKKGDFRMLSALKELKVLYVDIGETEYSADCLMNINHSDEYHRLITKSVSTTANKKKAPENTRINTYITVTAIVLLLTLSLSFCIGRYKVPPTQILKIIGTHFGLKIDQTWTDSMEKVVIFIRMPRIIMACLIGCCLAVSGCVYQSLFQNPMAVPDLLGATSGAAFGAALAIVMGAASLINILAFFFSLLAVFLVYIISTHAQGKKTLNLILSGIIVGSLFTSGTSYIKLAADPSDQLPAIIYWLMGSLSGMEISDISFVSIPMLLGLGVIFILRWRINILTLGDNEARTIGVNADLLRLILIVCSTLLTSAGVAVSGMIGWVGLMIPNLCRRLVGNDNRHLIPMCMLMGAVFLLLVDNISRTLLITEIPIGILTAFTGAPFFLYLFLGKRKIS